MKIEMKQNLHATRGNFLFFQQKQKDKRWKVKA